MANQDDTSGVGCGWLGCVTPFLGLWLTYLFFCGACAADPGQPGFGHDMQQGLNAIVQPFVKAWEAASNG